MGIGNDPVGKSVRYQQRTKQPNWPDVEAVERFAGQLPVPERQVDAVTRIWGTQCVCYIYLCTYVPFKNPTISYRVFIKYCVFFPKMLRFFWTLQFCCRAGVWPAIVYTHWHRGETESGQSPEYILKSSWKKYLMNTLYFSNNCFTPWMYACIIVHVF